MISESNNTRESHKSSRISSARGSKKRVKDGAMEVLKQSTFGTRGTNPGELLCPQAIVCSPVYKELYVLGESFYSSIE